LADQSAPLDVHLVEASSGWQATSDLYQFSFEEGSVSLDLLRVEAVSASREASTWVITASDPVATLGILPDDLTFYLSMHQVSPNEAIQSGFEFWPSESIDATGEELMGLALPDDLESDLRRNGNVQVARFDTLDNLSLDDLIEDINESLVRAGFREVYTVLNDQTLMLVSPHLFQWIPDGASFSQIQLLGFSEDREVTRDSQRGEPDYRVQPVGSMINGVLSEDIQLMLRIEGAADGVNVEVSVDATNGLEAGSYINRGPSDLAKDINRSLGQSALSGLVWAVDHRGVIVLESDQPFELQGEASAGLWQLGYDLTSQVSSLQSQQSILADEMLPVSAILEEDVTLGLRLQVDDGVFWSADVVLSQADTLNNHHVNDLLDDLEIAMKMAQWLDGDGNNTGAYVASNISLSA
ncbi:MAG: hypothetical protein EBU26_18360, partial [Verrucomicrobia bacterium]|nr:hypothetical protein [Verrucomicrobiota bacterium]